MCGLIKILTKISQILFQCISTKNIPANCGFVLDKIIDIISSAKKPVPFCRNMLGNVTLHISWHRHQENQKAYNKVSDTLQFTNHTDGNSKLEIRLHQLYFV